MKAGRGGAKVISVKAREVLDSRGNPTVEAEVAIPGGVVKAIVPSGASKGVHEALELRDGDKGRFHGKGVLKAVRNVNEVIGPKLQGTDVREQRDIDEVMIALDGTRDKSKLGANAILAVSMAVSKAAALAGGSGLYRALKPAKSYTLPVPMMNVINGGEHAGNGLAIQEFQVEPVGAKMCSEAIRIGVEVYQSLKGVLTEKYGRAAINVGDEGGFAPPLTKTREALTALDRALRQSGHEGEARLGVDAAASTFFDKKTRRYKMDGVVMDEGRLEDYYASLTDEFGLFTIEDPFEEEAFDAFASITKRLGRRVKIIGDDLYVTNVSRMELGIKRRATNAILIKLNQIGTVSETEDAMELASRSGWDSVVSHRSGDTDDPFIAHLATAFGALFIKTGAPARGERVAKYNELLRIEEELGKAAKFASP